MEFSPGYCRKWEKRECSLATKLSSFWQRKLGFPSFLNDSKPVTMVRNTHTRPTLCLVLDDCLPSGQYGPPCFPLGAIPQCAVASSIVQPLSLLKSTLDVPWVTWTRVCNNGCRPTWQELSFFSALSESIGWTCAHVWGPKLRAVWRVYKNTAPSWSSLGS